MTDLLQAATHLGEQAERRWEDLDRDCRIPNDLHVTAVESGLFRTLVPADMGGRGAAPLDWFRCGVELARHEASFGWVVTQGAVELGYIAAGGDTDWAREVLQDPRAASASSVSGMGVLRRQPSGLTLSGHWTFNTGAHGATWIGGLATFAGSSPPEIRLVWVPAANARILDDWDPTGLRGSDSGSTVIPEQHIDEAWVLRPFSAVEQNSGPYGCLLGNGNWPIACSVAATELGAARRAIDEAANFLHIKTSGADGKSLAHDPTAQRQMIAAESMWTACVALLERELGSMWIEAQRDGSLTTAQRVRLLAANSLAATQSVRVIDQMCELTGTLSIKREHPLSRARRDAQALRGHRAVNGEAVENAGKVWLGVIPEHRRV
ncbi:acyl-CoA dehydrogenase family protein [Amycolatopsis sp. NBC_00438]|uniref:acyl-CoA dehydrogenase family protein n=1 Tax=Amycolatopsis sp. NBC_00438 TaxID=2903558 RepID=UPI002E1BEF8B